MPTDVGNPTHTDIWIAITGLTKEVGAIKDLMSVRIETSREAVRDLKNDVNKLGARVRSLEDAKATDRGGELARGAVYGVIGAIGLAVLAATLAAVAPWMGQRLFSPHSAPPVVERRAQG